MYTGSNTKNPTPKMISKYFYRFNHEHFKIKIFDQFLMHFFFFFFSFRWKISPRYCAAGTARETCLSAVAYSFIIQRIAFRACVNNAFIIRRIMLFTQQAGPVSRACFNSFVCVEHALSHVSCVNPHAAIAHALGWHHVREHALTHVFTSACVYW